MLTPLSAEKRENAHFCFTSCSFFVEPRGKVVHVSAHTLDAVRKCICTVKLRTRQKATLKNASFSRAPESDGYDGDGQGGQFGASAASPL